MKIGYFVFITLLICSTSFAGQELTFKDLTATTTLPDSNNYKLSPKEDLSIQGNISNYYQYFDKDHTTGQDLGNLGIIYGISWALYPLLQHEDFASGSWTEYKQNFGKLVFDQDEPYWNWMVHPFTGSQLYLFYRSTGYSRFESFGMTFLSSALWEFTIEVYSEPASIQDLYQTPVLGSLLGFGLETLSMALLNQSNPMGTFFGTIFNLYTLFGWYDGKIQIVPSYYKKSGSVTIMGTF